MSTTPGAPKVSGRKGSPPAPAIGAGVAEELHRALLGASTFFEKALQDRFDAEGITPSQFYLLRTIAASAEGALSPKVLQQSFVRRRNLTETLQRIVRDGLAERIPNPDDGRSVLIALTPQGRQVLQRALHAYRDGLGLLRATPDPGAAVVTLAVLQELTNRLKYELYPELPGGDLDDAAQP